MRKIKTIWVALDECESIADNVFFSSYQEALNWKEERIAKGDNTDYYFKPLTDHSEQKEINARYEFLFGDK